MFILYFMCAIKMEYLAGCDILDLHAIPLLKYRPVKKIDWASLGSKSADRHIMC